MIFSRFIKPSFKDPNPEVRIQAIAKLDPQVVADKQKLHELAFNDSESNVSLTALERLESFPLWLKMSQIAVDLRIRKAALKKVLSILGNADSSLIDKQQRHSTIIESSEPSLLKFGLDNPELCALAEDDIIKLLKKLNDESLSRQIMLRTDSSFIQLSLIQEVGELAQLYKLRKKPLHHDSQQWIEAQIVKLEAEKELPKRLQQSITLSLSKLKALGEIGDYAKIFEQKHQLEKQIAEENERLSELDELLFTTNLEKLNSITTRLQAVLDQLKPAYEQDQLTQRLTESFNAWQAEVESTTDEVNTFIRGAFKQDDDQPVDISHLEPQLKSLVEQGEVHRALELAHANALIKQCESSLKTLVNAPLLIDTANEIQQAVNQFNATYTLPEDYHGIDQAKQVYSVLSDQVNTLMDKAQEQLPSAILKPWEQTKKHWSKQLSKLRKEANQQVNAVDKKIRAINALIKQGRFKAAIAVFTKTKRLYDDLPSSMQSRLERAFQSVSQEVSELKDWQTYIALPRKPELLAEVQALSKDNREVNVSARSNEVTRLRKNWLSLGKLDTAEDDILNKQFDEAIELAFAPCRQHYAQQQEAREKNAINATEVLKQLKACEALEDDGVFNKKYSSTLKAWNSLGQVERVQWQSLKSQFAEINKHLKQRQQNIQKSNATAKQQLVKQAEAFAESITEDAVESVKQLQTRWKSIGFAGKAKDNQLWASFRQANDQVFDKLRASKEAGKVASQQVFSEIEKQLDEVKKSLAVVDATQQLNEITSGLSELHQQTFEKMQQQLLSKSQFERLDRSTEQLKTKINGLQQQFKSALAKQKIDEVFEYLQTRVGEPSIFDGASPKALRSLQGDGRPSDVPRLHATIRLEVLAGIESPESDKALRQQIQLQVMANKMQSGVVDIPTTLFSSWLSAGAILPEESKLLGRLEAAYRATETSVSKSN